MRNVAHTDKLGRLAEDLALIQLATLFEDCIISKVENNQLHDIEIRKKNETLTENICKIQVKSTNSKGVVGKHEFYAVTIQHGAGSGKKQIYNRGDVNFFFFYVFPESTFYVVPAEVLTGKLGVKLYAGLARPKMGPAEYEKYTEAWWLIGDFLGVPTSDDNREIQTLLLSRDD
jgi:PD-(D/E)XK endonuclease